VWGGVGIWGVNKRISNSGGGINLSLGRIGERGGVINRLKFSLKKLWRLGQ